ncbi:signal peptidase II [Candidatus Peregrinibacteria bacterium]|nr:signal peptidase II [Candidatus Peregrinibacteria bacterium]MBI3816194.1 signal peptidase II [Candidatus Peregrinibacteria bacterium]
MLLTAGLVCALDLLVMVMVDRFLDHRIAILGSFIGLERSFNDGVAFSVHLPAQGLLVIVALTLVIIAAIRSERTRLNAVAFGLIIGGALGNIVDRLIDGLVTDYVQLGTFPVFNLADSCVTIGVALLALEIVVTWWIRKED